MKYYSVIKRNTIGLFVEMWMDLESVIPSEVSQKEKNKYCILIHIYIYIYGIQKNGTDELICREEIEVQTQRTDVWIQGKGQVGLIGKVGLTYIHYHDKIDSQWEAAEQCRSSAPYPVMTYRGGIGVEVGSGDTHTHTHTHTHVCGSLHCVAETNTTL